LCVAHKMAIVGKKIFGKLQPQACWSSYQS
jgi:hypothetical protein